MKNFIRLTAVLTFFLMTVPVIQAQDKFTVSGTIKDASNGEGLIGAIVQVQGQPIGTTTNEYGFYSLTLSRGEQTLVFSYLGYVNQVRQLNLQAPQKIDIQLSTRDVQMEEVLVTATRPDQNVRSMEMGVAKLEMKTIKSVPPLLGEVDVIRAIQLLPGVSTVGEGASGFNVRGGGVDQNLILLDEAPVYNSSHLLGFFSVFNPDAVKDVKLIKGGIPAQYGGRLSSILDVRMKEGNSKRFAASGGIGTISSRLTLEGPIQKDKSSFIVAGRRSYGDLFLKLSPNENMRSNPALLLRPEHQGKLHAWPQRPHLPVGLLRQRCFPLPVSRRRRRFQNALGQPYGHDPLEPPVLGQNFRQLHRRLQRLRLYAGRAHRGSGF
jgi:hypothetical protein